MEKQWVDLNPSELVEVFGSLIWNGKNCLIVLPKRIIDSFPDLKDKRKMVLYKMEAFLSKKQYQSSVEDILKGKKPVPIHLYLKREHDK